MVSSPSPPLESPVRICFDEVRWLPMVLLRAYFCGCHQAPPLEAFPSSVERTFGAGAEDWEPAVKGCLDSPEL